jgi:polyisoprenoid-binding protein YceI
MKLAQFVLPLALLASPALAADTYTLDPNHTNIVWRASHFGFSSPDGKWASASGEVVLDEAVPANSKVKVEIKLDGLVTGIPKFDDHLKSADFLDVSTYPVANFVSDVVEPTGKDTAKVTGTLTLRGVSKPVTLDVKLNKMGPHPMMNVPTVGFTATTVIKRSEFGISAYVPNISDEVQITIEAEANKKS